MKNILFSGIAGGIVFFALGGLFYGFLFADFFMNHLPEGMEIIMKEPEMLYLLLAHLILGIGFAYVFHSWTDISTFSKGAQLGLVIALAFSIQFNLIYSATTTLVVRISAFVDMCITAVSAAIGCGVIGLVLGKMKAA